MKKIILFSLVLFSCNSRPSREKDPDELVLHENIQQVKGFYYWGDCEMHAEKLCTTIDTSYHNGKIKAIWNIRNGIPEGHWQQYNDSGNKIIDLHFNKGLVVKKTISK